MYSVFYWLRDYNTIRGFISPTLKCYIDHNVDNVNKYEVVGHPKKMT